jgi:aryl-alcohol dehydrogenase-like predicted oxidoreductase
VPIPGTTKLSRLEENLGALSVELSTEDVAALEEASGAIKVLGERYPEANQRLIDR